MTTPPYKALWQAIQSKKSFLCVGLDAEVARLPSAFRKEKNPLLAFNRAVIEETHSYAVAYKFNLAFYEHEGARGLEALQESLRHLPNDTLAIADAKRSDIPATATRYAAAYLEQYAFGGITVSPYLGRDSLQPFFSYKDKWTIILGITSNEGARDFQSLPLAGGGTLYERVVKDCAKWGSRDNTMFVVGATQLDALCRIRSFFAPSFPSASGRGRARR